MTGLKKHQVTITYSNPQATPPIFVAGSFTHPPWEVYELDIKKLESDDKNAPAQPEDLKATFAKTFEVEEGQWHYKFRLGHGDWWVCDEGAEIVTDAIGNPNNLLVVGAVSVPETTEPRSTPARNAPSSESAQEDQGHRDGSSDHPSGPQVDSESSEGKPSGHAHQAEGNKTLRGPGRGVQEGSSKGHSEDNEAKPLSGSFTDRRMSKSEIYWVKEIMTLPVEPIQEHINKIQESISPPKDVLHGQDSDTAAKELETLTPGSGAPLLPHESLSSADEDVCPSDNDVPYDRSRQASLSLVSPPPTKADFDDPNVEKFPDTKLGILHRLQALKSELPSDESAHLEDTKSPDVERTIPTPGPTDVQAPIAPSDTALPNGSTEDLQDPKSSSHPTIMDAVNDPAQASAKVPTDDKVVPETSKPALSPGDDTSKSVKDSKEMDGEEPVHSNEDSLDTTGAAHKDSTKGIGQRLVDGITGLIPVHFGEV